MDKDGIMKREIKNPLWTDSNKNKIVCEFHYNDGRVLTAHVSDTAEGNPDWKELMEKFGPEKIDQATEAQNKKIEERKELLKQEQKEQQQTVTNEMLFNAKLEAFSIPEIKNSTNREFKSRIRKAKSITEVLIYSAVLVGIEINKPVEAPIEEESKKSKEKSK